MEKYTDFSIKRFLQFIRKKSKGLIICGLVFGTIMAASLFINYNSIDNYYLDGMSRSEVESKVDRIESEIDYLKKSLDKNNEYIENSLLYTYSKTGAFKYVFLLKTSHLTDNDRAELLSNLYGNQYYVYLALESDLNVEYKYLKEVIMFSENKKNILMAVYFDDDTSYSSLIQVTKNYVYGLTKKDISITLESQRNIPASQFDSKAYVDFAKSTEATIKARQNEILVFNNYLKADKTLDYSDFFIILMFSIAWCLVLGFLCLFIIYNTKEVLFEKEQFERLGIKLSSHDSSKAKPLVINDIKLIYYQFKKFELGSKVECVKVIPGIFSSKLLMKLYIKNPNLKIYFGED